MITPSLGQNRPMTDATDVFKAGSLREWIGKTTQVVSQTVCQVTLPEDWKSSLAGIANNVVKKMPLSAWAGKVIQVATGTNFQHTDDRKLLMFKIIENFKVPDDYPRDIPWEVQEDAAKNTLGELPFYTVINPGCLLHTYGSIKGEKLKVLMDAFYECGKEFPDDIISVGSGFSLIESAFCFIPPKIVQCFDKQPMRFTSMEVTQASIPEDMDKILPEDCSKTMLMINYPRGQLGKTLEEFTKRGGKTVFMNLDKSLESVHFKYEPDKGKTAVAEILKLSQEKKTTAFAVDLSDGVYDVHKVNGFCSPQENKEKMTYKHNNGPTYAVCLNGPKNFQLALKRASERARIPVEAQEFTSVPWEGPYFSEFRPSED